MIVSIHFFFLPAWFSLQHLRFCIVAWLCKTMELYWFCSSDRPGLTIKTHRPLPLRPTETSSDKNADKKYAFLSMETRADYRPMEVNMNWSVVSPHMLSLDEYYEWFIKRCQLYVFFFFCLTFWCLNNIAMNGASSAEVGFCNVKEIVDCCSPSRYYFWFISSFIVGVTLDVTDSKWPCGNAWHRDACSLL